MLTFPVEDKSIVLIAIKKAVVLPEGFEGRVQETIRDIKQSGILILDKLFKSEDKLKIVYIFNKIIHSLRDSVIIAEKFHDYSISEGRTHKTFKLDVDDLIEDYDLFRARVIYYDNSYEYAPMEYNERELVFSDFFDEYNDVEERIELLDGDLLLLFCLRSNP